MKLHFRALTVLVCLCAAFSTHANCTSEPANEVGNCGFDDDPLGVTWISTGGGISRDTSVMRSGPASLQINAVETIPGFFYQASALSQCFSTTNDPSYGFGGWVRLDMAVSPAPGCQINLQQYSDPMCMTSTVIVNSSSLTPTTSFQRINTTANVTSGFATLSISCSILMGGAVDFTVYFDDTFAGPSLVPVELTSFDVE